MTDSIFEVIVQANGLVKKEAQRRRTVVTPDMQVYGTTLATTVLRIIAMRPDRERILDELNADTQCAEGVN